MINVFVPIGDKNSFTASFVYFDNYPIYLEKFQ